MKNFEKPGKLPNYLKRQSRPRSKLSLKPTKPEKASDTAVSQPDQAVDPGVPKTKA